MKKAFIGALVGAILVFGWQAIAHMLMQHHEPAYKQVPAQEDVIQTLSEIFKEDGQYLIPRPNLNSSQEEIASFEERMKGRPWALVTYHAANNYNMGMNIIRSFTTAFLCVLLLIGLIGKNPNGFFSVFLKSIGVAAFIFLFVYYNSNIWMQTPWEVIKPELIDLVASWGLCGIWLGWWLNRGERR